MSLPRGELEIVAEPTPSAMAEGGRYVFLSQRAVAFVREQGGAVKEEELVRFVFGAGSAAALWQPLLRQVLSAGDELELRTDGYWATPGTTAAPRETMLDEFVAIDVETTGLRPLQQRIIEIALIRFRGGVEVGRFESLIFPERRLPTFIVKLTGLSDQQLESARLFAEVADAVVEFIGSSLIVGHNVGFDVGFLNAELGRVGRPTLINERLDTMGLAMRLLSNLRKASLDKVALALGLNPRHVHRAAVDAELAAHCALKLAEIARSSGHPSVERLKALSTLPERRSRDDVGRGRAVLDRSLLADIPKRPGVYIMRDAFEHVIYVGKAKNLYDRVSSYYSQALGLTRKMDGLLETLVKIDVEVTGTELDALLLESQLIRRYQPRYNVQMRSHEEYPFIRVDLANPWPRVTLAKMRKDDGSRYFGPFRHRRAAQAAVELINDHFPLRTCPRSFKTARSYGAPCLRLDLGKCPGPCVGKAVRDDYMANVREVVRFLDGEDDALYARIWEGLEQAATRLDFEKARRLRNDLWQLQNVVAGQRTLREATERHTLLLALPSAELGSIEVLLLIHGRVWARLKASRAGGADGLADRIASSWARARAAKLGAIDHDTLDEANILNRWIARRWGHPAIFPLADDQPDWRELASAVQSLDLDALDFEVRGGDTSGAETHGDGLGDGDGADSNSSVGGIDGVDRLDRPAPKARREASVGAGSVRAVH